MLAPAGRSSTTSHARLRSFAASVGPKRGSQVAGDLENLLRARSDSPEIAADRPGSVASARRPLPWPGSAAPPSAPAAQVPGGAAPAVVQRQRAPGGLPQAGHPVVTVADLLGASPAKAPAPARPAPPSEDRPALSWQAGGGATPDAATAPRTPEPGAALSWQAPASSLSWEARPPVADAQNPAPPTAPAASPAIDGLAAAELRTLLRSLARREPEVLGLLAEIGRNLDQDASRKAWRRL